ncbi:MAG: 23S rRNA (guanosine(2251)-2'-O)-methyltransferase RlmB [Actinomycetes bacterium]
MTKKKGPTAGSGGQGKRRLQGRGPTPRAEERPGHPAARRAAAARAALAQRSADDTVAGRNAVVEALQAEVPATSLVVAKGLDFDSRVAEALRLARARALPVNERPRAELDRLAGGTHHQGLLLAAAPYSYLEPEDLVTRALDRGDPPLIVALDGVTDPHNLGAIIRSAAAFGAHGVLIPVRRSARMTPGAWKSSAGTAARLPVARATNLRRALDGYADRGLTIAGLTAHAAGARELADLDGAGPLVLVAGAERVGLSRLVREACQVEVAIAAAGGAESLNVSVAVGVTLYAVAEQRRAAGRL